MFLFAVYEVGEGLKRKGEILLSKAFINVFEKKYILSIVTKPVRALSDDMFFTYVCFHT